MLKLMPIPCVRQMNEVIPTRRRTNNGGRRMLTSGSDVCDTQASDSNFLHGGNHSKTNSIGLHVVVSYHKHDPVRLSVCNQHTITKR